MADPTTVNIALNVPITGSNVGTWGDVSINPDMVAIDGMIGGVQGVSLSNVPVTLSAPAAVITPGAGPTQSQNAVLVFSGALSANVTVTLPLPGVQRIVNFTTGNFVVTFRAVAVGEVIAVDQGAVVDVYNDGTNVRFISTGNFPGQMIHLAGLSAVPAWITACTRKPYLLADGTIYNISDYPYLAARYGTKFGGNGLTTFGVPDMGGRLPIAYDTTGTRITTSGCGIDGQSIGAAGGAQNIQLTVSQLPKFTPSATTAKHSHGLLTGNTVGVAPGGSAYGFPNPGSNFPGAAVTNQGVTNDANLTITVAEIGGDQAHFNVQPGLVTGIWLVKT